MEYKARVNGADFLIDGATDEAITIHMRCDDTETAMIAMVNIKDAREIIKALEYGIKDCKEQLINKQR